MADQHVLLARQPIFDLEQNVIAYELLFRSMQDSQSATFTDGDSATSQVLLNAFTELDLNEVIGPDQKAFVNFTRNLILQPQAFDQKHFVIEVLEGLEVDQALLEGLARLKQQGFTIALDDFLLNNETKALLKYADIVKLDVMELTGERLIRHIERLKRFPVQLLAEKVETHEVFDHCKELGCTLFQGYFLSKPQLVKGHKLSDNKHAVANLLNKIHQPDVEVEELEEAISSDPVLTYKLLRLINSAAFSPPKEITSIKHVISMLGLEQLKSWCTLLSLSCLGDKPHELSINTMVRAKMCQLLGEKVPGADAGSYFTVGLLSTLNAYLDQSLSELVPKFNLSNAMKLALLQRKGKLGLVLGSVIKFERAQWHRIKWESLASIQITQKDAEMAYRGSLRWATEVSKTINQRS